MAQLIQNHKHKLDEVGGDFLIRQYSEGLPTNAVTLTRKEAEQLATAILWQLADKEAANSEH